MYCTVKLHCNSTKFVICSSDIPCMKRSHTYCRSLHQSIQMYTRVNWNVVFMSIFSLAFAFTFLSPTHYSRVPKTWWIISISIISLYIRENKLSYHIMRPLRKLIIPQDFTQFYIKNPIDNFQFTKNACAMCVYLGILYLMPFYFLRSSIVGIVELFFSSSLHSVLSFPLPFRISGEMR